jgi:hypothetical protein
MTDLKVVPMQSLGRQFVPREFLPPETDEYHLRNRQLDAPPDAFRRLRPEEIETLVKNGNTSDNWEEILVDDRFNPLHVKNCEFFGLVRIGHIEDVSLRHHDLQVPVGITNSRIVACDIGDNTAIHNVRYLSHYIIGSNVMLLNIDEMQTSNHAKFGNGFVKDGEDEELRIRIDLGNEAGGRSVMPFDGMTPGDAYLWSRYRQDRQLMDRLALITQGRFDSQRGYYGQVGDRTVIKNCRIIKDVKFGSAAYVKGANKLKNLTINSTDEEPSQIGEGVELVNGIIAQGCHIFYGCKAVRFIMGPCSNLKYGARLIHSYLGDNSTVSCCEILNNLIFPAHEQHHNNSFLIASTVLGQSNIAAGATIGSNHNSRANDGEILAGRGFWPGLCTSLKHSCRFASFTLLAKGDYPAELNIPLPFSLLSNDVSRDRLLVMPAYWWLYNAYALMRNTWKFQHRDKRVVKTQHVEFDFLAPDTVEEILTARRLLAIWTAKARLHQAGNSTQDLREDDLAERGTTLLDGAEHETVDLAVRGERMEHSGREVVILKHRKAWHAYRDMLLYYAVRNLMDWLEFHDGAAIAEMTDALDVPRQADWVNLGGQLIPAPDVDTLRADIRTGSLADWDAIHARCDELSKAYPLQKQRHAFAVLLDLLPDGELTAQVWPDALDRAVAIQKGLARRTFESRRKDYDNPFRRNTVGNDDEHAAVFGRPEDNPFVQQINEDTARFTRRAETLKNRT